VYAYWHCIDCIEELPAHVSARDYSHISVGVTNQGDLIVWCDRHDQQILKIDNETVQKELQEAGMSACPHCGETETKH